MKYPWKKLKLVNLYLKQLFMLIIHFIAKIYKLLGTT